MKVLITGHRLFKLQNYSYDTIWIQRALSDVVIELKDLGVLTYGYSGMASGVDLWFCRELFVSGIPYAACVPFEEQSETMDKIEQDTRDTLLKHAATHLKVKNSYMVEKADMGIVVWDGNKGGTHNVVQQLVEKKKDFVWINPVSQVIWKCFK